MPRSLSNIVRPLNIVLTISILILLTLYTVKLKIKTNEGYSKTHAFSTITSINATNGSNASAASIVYTLSTNSSSTSAIVSTSSTSATINEETVITSTPSTIDDSSIDQYHAWMKSFSNYSVKFPYSDLLVPPMKILETQWAPELWKNLSELDTKYVSLCIGSSAYLEIILNWLIAAMVITKPPLENVLVISLDTKLHKVLQEHDINSVYVNPLTVLRSKVNVEEEIAYFWVTRLVIFRLINHWGYTVATYDSDAIPIKNPEKLFAKFEDIDVIGTISGFPRHLYVKWGAILCMGMVVFKASKATEEYWNFVSARITMKEPDDQLLMNEGLDMCGIKWHRTSSSMTGSCSRYVNLTVTLLSLTDVCRHCANNINYFVWHERVPKKAKLKKQAAENGKVWFLKEDYDDKVDLKGLEWLYKISV